MGLYCKLFNCKYCGIINNLGDNEYIVCYWSGRCIYESKVEIIQKILNV